MASKMVKESFTYGTEYRDEGCDALVILVIVAKEAEE
jgi:hypothetical protein